MDKQKSFRWADRQQSFRDRSKESPGKRGDTELHLAARAGNTIHVQRILAECKEEEERNLICKQNQDGETAMYVAAEKGHADIVREMLKVSDFQSAAIKANNSYDAFHIAAKQGHLEIITDLLSSFSALAMTTNSMNSTPLDTAATKGHIGIVNLLLETDSSLAKIARNNGKTALHSAARMGHVEVVKSLLDNDPTICLRIDRKGQTAFHMAAKSHNVDVVMELLKPDASIVNLEDSKGNTALHIATRKGNQSILKALLSVKGINVNAVNKTGETALSIAEKVSNEDVATLLKEFHGVAEKNNPPKAAKQLKQTVSDIKHDVQSQLRQTQQTEMKVQNIRKKIQKLNYGALNNTINSNTVVAVLIATVAFAAIFQLPGQYVDVAENGFNPGEAYIAKNVAFVVFLISDSLALFISLAVVVVQTSLIVVEQKAKKRMVFVMNKLMWLACISISVAFISITYIVIGRHDTWLAWSTMVIGTTIMLTILGCMCYCIITHRIEEKTMKSIRIRTTEGRSLSWSLSVASDPEMLNGEHKKIFAL